MVNLVGIDVHMSYIHNMKSQLQRPLAVTKLIISLKNSA